MSALKTASYRLTQPGAPPFLKAQIVPADSYKTVTDTWQGLHMIPLHKDSREFTNFVTEWGMFLLQEDADGGPHVDGRIQLQVGQGHG